MTVHIAIQNDQRNDRYAWVMFAALLGVLIAICVTSVMYFLYKRSMYCFIFILSILQIFLNQDHIQ